MWEGGEAMLMKCLMGRLALLINSSCCYYCGCCRFLTPGSLHRCQGSPNAGHLPTLPAAQRGLLTEQASIT